MTALAILTEQERHETNRRRDELEELGIGRRPCTHVTTELPSGECRCVLCDQVTDGDGRVVEVAS